jgi:hypothetical protein
MHRRFSLIRGFAVCATAAICPSLWAVCSCYSNDLTRDFRDLVVKVAEFSDSTTHRQTVFDYAALHGLPARFVNAATAATGKLDCNGSVVSANLTGRADVIATVGHALNDPDTCEKVASASDCKFIASDGATPVPVARLVDSGFKCPQIPGFGDDWAVMKLRSPVKGVVPYALPKENPTRLRDGGKVIAVGAYSVDFPLRDPATKKIVVDARTGKPVFPKHIQDCSIDHVYAKFSPHYMSERCDGSYGKSGGALLDTDLSRPTLLAISNGHSASQAELDHERATATPIRKPFDRQSWSDGSTAVDGKFLDALKKAAKGFVEAGDQG